GTPRSGMGNETNSIACLLQRLVSRCRPNSATSSYSSRLTTTSIPSVFQPAISSSSQSPARGLGMIASRPVGDDASIQCTSGRISCAPVKWDNIPSHRSLTQETITMMTVHNFARGARGLRVMWLCEEMGLAYDVRNHPFPVGADYRTLHPMGTVPFLQDSGDV